MLAVTASHVVGITLSDWDDPAAREALVDSSAKC
jgi:hypothetical protein